MATLFRPPVITPRVAIKAQQPTIVTNLLITILAVVAPATPVKSGQISLPGSFHRGWVQQVPAQPSTFDLTTKSLNPFIAQRTELPPRGLVSLIQCSPAQPATFDISTRALNPFTQEDWHLPRRRTPSQQPDNQNWVDRTPIVVAVPFQQSVWPNPITKKLRVGVAAVPPYDRTVDGPFPDPFSQKEWNNPVRRKISLHIDAPQPFNRTVTPVPFAQISWPNPTLHGVQKAEYFQAIGISAIFTATGAGILTATSSTMSGSGTVTGTGFVHVGRPRSIDFDKEPIWFRT